MRRNVKTRCIYLHLHDKSVAGIVNDCFIMVVPFKYCRYSYNRLLSTLATTLPMAMSKTVIGNIDAARRRLETARHGCDTLAATFPSTTLAAERALLWDRNCWPSMLRRCLGRRSFLRCFATPRRIGGFWIELSEPIGPADPTGTCTPVPAPALLQPLLLLCLRPAALGPVPLSQCKQVQIWAHAAAPACHRGLAPPARRSSFVP